jgi:hypothetical protein
MAKRTKNAEAFLGLVADELQCSSGGVILVDLHNAAEMLFWSLIEPWRRHRDGELSEAEYDAVLDRAMAEVDEKTVGQPFRFDMPNGRTVFSWEPLWRFAGRCGPHVGPNDNPTWDGDWTDVEGDDAALFDEARDQAVA